MVGWSLLGVSGMFLASAIWAFLRWFELGGRKMLALSSSLGVVSIAVAFAGLSIAVGQERRECEAKGGTIPSIEVGCVAVLDGQIRDIS